MEDRDSRLQEVARIAVRLQAETGCPAQLMIAQWAVESQWGAKPVGQHNYFGIKMAPRHTMCCTVTTTEVLDGERVKMDLAFADYSSLEESCRDFAWLITRGAPYKAAWQAYQATRDLHALITAVAKTYATDPHYATTVSLIASQANVANAIVAARQEANHAVLA
ncbi:MAG TPA: glucosaminidase domain-containing protein [Bryobacteraceae bacterium]|nr:glucosaminidase domain-containing protein [Bryobacteraceae bacterium]